MLRILIGAAAISVLLTGVAKAQFSNTGNTGNAGNGSGFGMNMLPDNRRHLTPDEMRQERDIESKYNETVNDKIPDKKGTKDPWGNIRSTPTASAATKSQKQ